MFNALQNFRVTIKTSGFVFFFIEVFCVNHDPMNCDKKAKTPKKYMKNYHKVNQSQMGLNDFIVTNEWVWVLKIYTNTIFVCLCLPLFISHFTREIY